MKSSVIQGKLRVTAQGEYLLIPPAESRADPVRIIQSALRHDFIKPLCLQDRYTAILDSRGEPVAVFPDSRALQLILALLER